MADLRARGAKFSYVRYSEPPSKIEKIPSRISQVAVLPGFLLLDYKTYEEQKRYIEVLSKAVVRGCYPGARFVIPNLPDLAELFYLYRKACGKFLIPNNEAVFVRISTQIKTGLLKPIYQRETLPGQFASAGNYTEENGLLIDDNTISGARLVVLPIVVPAPRKQTPEDFRFNSAVFSTPQTA